MIISRSSRDKEKIIYPIFSSMLVFNLSWDCTGFVHLDKITVTLTMHPPCYIQKKMLPRLKHSFWPFFCRDPWALSKSRIAIYAPFGDEHSSVFYFQHLGYCEKLGFHYLLQAEASQIKKRSFGRVCACVFTHS